MPPLKKTLGSPADGEDRFFIREKIIKNIRKEINNKENLLLSAPRRIGKTSILQYLCKNPQENQIIKYIITQGVHNEQEYFKLLFNAILEDKKIVEKYFKIAKNSVKNYIQNLTFIDLKGKIELSQDEHIDYYQECKLLLENIDEQKQIIIFVDEFPDTIHNIAKNSEQEAILFLQKNRELRQKYSLQFVYTGSTGLSNIVERLNKLDLINDIMTIKVPPLSKKEASELISCLVSGFQEESPDFHLSSEVIDYINYKVTWLIPYYLQIIIYEIHEYYDEHKEKIDTTKIDEILHNITNSQSSHSTYFANWKTRLMTSLKGDEYKFAVDVLNHISKENTISYSTFYDKSEQYNIDDDKYILKVLIHDGYISEDNQEYGFNSFLLKQWWFKNVAL